MRRYLMHRDIPVAEVSNRNQLIKIICQNEMPIGTIGKTKQLTERLFDNWQTLCIIPKDRQNLQAIIKALEKLPSEAFIDSLGVNLTDCYWFKSEDVQLTWKDVNFHDNGFSEEIADISLFQNINLINHNYNSPDLTTNGSLTKGWKSIDGIPTLLKFGKTEDNIESANEIIVSKIADILKIPHVSYNLFQIHNKKLCGCPCLIQDSNHEMFFLQQVEHVDPKYFRSMAYFSETNTKAQFQEYLFLAALVNNVDMHQQNISFIRNLDTGEIQLAPLYDFGDSFHNKNIELKPFGWTREKTFSSISVPFVVIKDIIPIVEDVYKLFDISDEKLQTAISSLSTGIDLYTMIKYKQKEEYFYEI